MNEEPFLEVIRMHRDATARIDSKRVPEALYLKRPRCWEEAYELGQQSGFRNAQTTVIAPTGTIGFMMDCDTTGIEPDLALVKYKKLVGGGVIKIVNNTVPAALIKLGYTPRSGEQDCRSHRFHRDHRRRAVPQRRAPGRFSIAVSGRRTASRSIHYMGHVRMMAAVQPFISGAISKTINMPEESTAEEIMDAYIESWRLGLKAVAIYRDNSKRVQPMSSRNVEGREAESATTVMKVEERIVYRPVRRKLRRYARVRSPTSSRSAAMKATSRSACTTTARRASCSSPWRRKARPFRA